MSTNTDAFRPLNRITANRITATVRGRAITLTKPTSVTETFFARGEEQEATAYEHLAPDDPILSPPEVEFDSFDKIPRRRGSWFATAVSMVVVAAIGFVTWRSFHSLSKPGSSVATASRAMVQTPPTPAEPGPVAQSVPTPPAPDMPAVTVAPIAQTTPIAPIAQTTPEPVAQTTPVARPAVAKRVATSAQTAKPAPIVVPLITKDVTVAKQAPAVHERSNNDTSSESVEIRKHAPLRGYVWSPEKQTLVPADQVLEDPPAADSPRSQSLDGTPAEEPQPPAPAPTTSPAPFEPPPSATPSSHNEAPIIE